MRKIVFLFFLCLFYYVGAMYGNAALLVLSLTQFLLMFLMFLMSRYLGKHLIFSPREKTVYTEMGQPFTLRFQIENTGKFSAGRIALRFRCRCENNGIRYSKKKSLTKMYDKDNLLTLQEIYNHCGIYTIHLKQLSVFDPLILFSAKQKLQDEIRVIVFPVKYRMRLKLSDSRMGEEGAEVYGRTGDDQDEIRQIREYREGDLLRHIHWNQTARTDRVWVKEFESQKSGQMELYLDFFGKQPFQIPDLDAFFILLNALIYGMLENVASVKVFWQRTSEMTETSMEISDEQQCQDLMIYLYNNLKEKYLSAYETGQEAHMKMPESIPNGVLRLTSGLGLYKGEKLIFQFTGENLQETLEQNEISIQAGGQK